MISQPGLRPEPKRVEKKMAEKNMGRTEESKTTIPSPLAIFVPWRET